MNVNQPSLQLLLNLSSPIYSTVSKKWYKSRNP